MCNVTKQPWDVPIFFEKYTPTGDTSGWLTEGLWPLVLAQVARTVMDRASWGFQYRVLHDKTLI